MFLLLIILFYLLLLSMSCAERSLLCTKSVTDNTAKSFHKNFVRQLEKVIKHTKNVDSPVAIIEYGLWLCTLFQILQRTSHRDLGWTNCVLWYHWFKGLYNPDSITAGTDISSEEQEIQVYVKLWIIRFYRIGMENFGGCFF